MVGLTREGAPTLTAILLFSLFPQGYFPQLCITAVSIPGTEVGQIGSDGERFLDNRRIEGTLTEMLEEAVAFVRNNIYIKTIIDQTDGRRTYQGDYPLAAVREAILNALIHRDYSIRTEKMPIQILLFEDRFEIRNPGGLYGWLWIDQLGKVQPVARNPVLAAAMEVFGEVESRYSGIPAMRRELTQAAMPEPEFWDEQGTFVVCFRKA